jgi:ribose transport system ATP-binding protein
LDTLITPAMLRLCMVDIHKRYGSTVALDGVALEVEPSEVHALVGENGAGKSTLMKILSGAEQPDAGSMSLDGSVFKPAGPQEARLGGVAMVYQELALAPHLDVETNLMLGLERRPWGFVERAKERGRVRSVLGMLEHPEIRPETPIRQLSAGACQLVEIARALAADSRVIVLDEPTSSLGRHDAEHLFELIGRLKARGVSIVYISHFLEEVQRVADRYTVLRDGRTVGTGNVAATTLETIIEQMVGRRLQELYPRRPYQIGPPILQVRRLAGDPLPSALSFTLRRGQVLGIFGLIGAGRTELLRALFGLDPVTAGEVLVKDRTCTHANPSQRVADGFGFLSENRKAEGLALSRSISDNLTYSRLERYACMGFLRLRRRRAAVDSWVSRLQVRCRAPEQRVVELSGGNQQKIALGRLLHQEADVLLLDEPTRGVDVGSKAEIYRLIGELAEAGKAIVFVSSYVPELLGVCDDLAVMARGRLSSVRPCSEWSMEQIMGFATGGADR